MWRNSWRAFEALAARFVRTRRGNVAVIFALSLIPLTIAAGAGLDLSRALMVRARLAEALDAAGLAVGATQNLTNDQITSLARAYFKANYTADSSFGVPADVNVVAPGDQTVTLSTSVSMPTTLMRVVGIDNLTVGYSSKVVWGQTRLWVSLVLDNTGSMTQTDSTGTSKIDALKTATHQLLTTLQGASANPGDVKVAIIPFSKTVNVGTSNSGATWIDWTDWAAAPPNSTPSSSVGPGSACPYSTFTNGFRCQTGPSNGSSRASTIPSSGSYKGYICPSVDSGGVNNVSSGHYYNGCYNSTPTQTQTTTSTTDQPIIIKQSCSQVGSGSITCNNNSGYPKNNGSSTTNSSTTTGSGYTGDSTTSSSSTTNVSTSDGTKSCSGRRTQTCTWTRTITEDQNTTTITATGVGPYNHTWIANDHSTWGGCIEDRTQDYDISNTTATNSSTNFPAENDQNCVPTVMKGSLSYDWSGLSTEVDSMSAGGSTNQPIGLAWGWQALTDGDPLNAGTLPANTSRYIILVSDGLNTQDRWYGDGSNQSSQVDGRMSSLCTAAKANGITIYTVFVDLNGTQGNSQVLQDCATDSSKYFDLTTSGAIITTLNAIAQQITQLRVAQ
ncbi:MAG: pilus assembly protein TadG-related protein [Rhizomicrobium sp.]